MLIGAKLVTLLPLALGAIGLMALKALVVGKIALIFAAILAFQKFFAGGAGNIGGFGKVRLQRAFIRTRLERPENFMNQRAFFRRGWGLQ